MGSLVGKPGNWTVDKIPNLSGKIIIITGANSGTGFEAARAFAMKNATTILACRSLERGQKACDQIQNEIPYADLDLIQLDLADMTSIKKFANDFINKYDHLDILINNAGIMTPPYGLTKEGFELQFGINHLGHFALTGLLLESILKTKGSRVVTMSSLTHSIGKIEFEDLHYERKYKPIKAYSQSKLANLLFALELQRKLEKEGFEVISVAAHPGWAGTNILRKDGILQYFNKLLGMKPEQGALSLIFAAVAEKVVGGAYYGPNGLKEIRGYPGVSKIAPGAKDQKVAKRLWEVSENLSGVKYVFN